jgi:hypothetical protein
MERSRVEIDARVEPIGARSSNPGDAVSAVEQFARDVPAGVARYAEDDDVVHCDLQLMRNDPAGIDSDALVRPGTPVDYTGTNPSELVVSTEARPEESTFVPARTRHRRPGSMRLRSNMC